MQPLNLDYNGYLVTTDKDKMIPTDIHKWLSEESYWAKYMPWDIFKRSFDNSFCIGVIKDGKQVGYARLITDYATFGYLADVFVYEEHRAKGLSKIMMEELFNIDWVKGLRRIMLATKDAHELYRKVGFHASNYPDRLMEIARPNIYGDTETRC